MRKEVYPPSKNRTGGRTERAKTVPNDQSFKNVPNDYLGMSCGEENGKSPAAGSGRTFGRGLGCEGSLGELGLERSDALVGVDGKAGLLLQDHSGHEGVMRVS